MAIQYRPRVQNDPNYESEEISHAGDTYIWEAYEDGDLNGSAINFAFYLSDSPGDQYIWDLSLIGIEINASYCNFRDTKVINGTIHANLTCIGIDQNNEGIEFESSPTPAPEPPIDFRSRDWDRSKPVFRPAQPSIIIKNKYIHPIDGERLGEIESLHY